MQLRPIRTRITWRHPQCWLFSVSVIAWLAIGTNDTVHHHHHASMISAWISETYCWMLMVVAMMLPLISGSARIVATRSLWSRRQHAIVGFVIGYLCIWLIAGTIVSLLHESVRSQAWFDPSLAITCCFLLAVVWQIVPIKKRALIACHRTRPIAPEGLKANVDCLAYGWMIGGSCLLNCWAWMLFCTLTGHQPIVMAFAMLIGIAERYPIRKLFRINLPSATLPASIR